MTSTNRAFHDIFDFKKGFKVDLKKFMKHSLFGFLGAMLSKLPSQFTKKIHVIYILRDTIIVS